MTDTMTDYMTDNIEKLPHINACKTQDSLGAATTKPLRERVAAPS